MTLNVKNESMNDFIKNKEKRDIGLRATKDEIYTDEDEYNDLADFFKQYYPDDFKRPIIRPFYPGGDYTDLTQYPADCLVFDNPPFSIESKIIKFYNEHNIKYILFAPGNNLSNMRNGCSTWTGCTIHYDVAAFFSQFLTNLDEQQTLHISGELYNFMRSRFFERHPPKKHIKEMLPADCYYSGNIQVMARHGENKTINLTKDSYCFAREFNGTKIFGGCIIPVDKYDAR